MKSEHVKNALHKAYLDRQNRYEPEVGHEEIHVNNEKKFIAKDHKNGTGIQDGEKLGRKKAKAGSNSKSTGPHKDSQKHSEEHAETDANYKHAKDKYDPYKKEKYSSFQQKIRAKSGDVTPEHSNSTAKSKKSPYYGG